MKTKIIFLFIYIAIGCFEVKSQATVGSDKDPDASSLLEFSNVNSGPSTKGFLVPRVATLDTAQFGLSGNSQTEGMLVYNMTPGSNNYGKGLYYWNGNRWIYMKAYNDQSQWKLNGNNNGAIKTIGTKDAIDFPMITKNTELMRITSDGKVGVGTANPKAVFSVSGGVMSQDDYTDSDGMLLLGNTKSAKITHESGWIVSTYAGSIVDANSNNLSRNSGKFVWNVADANNTWRETLRLENNGYLGIGTTTPQSKLHVSGGDAILRGEVFYKNALPSLPTDQILHIGTTSQLASQRFVFLNLIPQQQRVSTTRISTGSTGSVTITARTNSYILNVSTGNGCGRLGTATFMVGNGILAFLGGTTRDNFYTATLLNTQGTQYRITGTLGTACQDGGGGNQFNFDIALSGNTISITNRNGTTDQIYDLVAIER